MPEPVRGAGALQRSYRARSGLRTVCIERVVRKKAGWMMEKWCALDENDSLNIMMQASYNSCSDVRSTKLCEKASLYWEATKEPLINMQRKPHLVWRGGLLDNDRSTRRTAPLPQVQLAPCARTLASHG